MENTTLLGSLGEFGNVGALMHENPDLQDEVGKLQRTDPVAAERIMRKRQASYIEEFKTWMRAEFEVRLDQLPNAIKTKLGKGEMQLFDAQYYSIRKVEASVKLFKGDDPVVEGIRNLSNAKLEKDVYFLLCGLQFLYSPSAVGEVDPAVLYKPLDTVAVNGSVVGLAQGEFTLRNANKTIMKGLPMMRFANNAVTHDSKIAPGFMRLDSPKFLEPQQTNEAEIALAQGVTLPGNPGYVYAAFWGIETRSR